jgi:hypothetical protein
MTRLALALSALAALSTGCGTHGLVCDDMAVAAVFITVIDIDGAPIDSATATWENAGESGDCDALAEGGIACAYEREGAVTVTITAEGFETITQSFDVAADGCHPIPEQAEITLRLLAEGEPV